LNYQDSPLSKATSGIGVVSSSGGLRPEILYSNVENIPKVSKDSDNSYEKFRFLWRMTVEDPKFIAYVQSHLPTTLSNTIGFIPEVKPNKESTGYSTFAYDAITALGWSYCLAANTTNNAEFDGSNVFSNFSNLDFNGASGKVKVIPETGTRNITSVHYILSNFQIQEIDQDGNQIYKIVPVRYYNNVWEVIEGRDFVFAEGSTRIPESLPPPNVQMNYIGSIGRYVGYTLMGIVVVSSLVAFIWLFYFRKERVVRSSQPLFLYMIALGSLVMVSSIIPLSLEEPVADRDLDAACMVAPWLYISGAVLVFSALLAKIRVVRHVSSRSLPYLICLCQHSHI
jgi:7 transmembrane sweet-taste receptor of 3 GCPR